MSPPAKCRKLDLSEEFKIVVGIEENQQTFTVAKYFLTKSSDFFRKACNGSWDESKTNTIKLPEVAPDIFSIYLQWLYTGDLIVTDEVTLIKSDNAASGQFDAQQYQSGIGVFIFADGIMDTQLQNDAMDFLRGAVSSCTIFPGTPEAPQVVGGTTVGSHLRSFMVDTLCCNTSPHWIRRNGHKLPLEIMIGMIATFATRRASSEAFICPSKAPKCEYHIHNEDNPKCE